MTIVSGFYRNLRGIWKKNFFIAFSNSYRTRWLFSSTVSILFWSNFLNYLQFSSFKKIPTQFQNFQFDIHEQPQLCELNVHFTLHALEISLALSSRFCGSVEQVSSVLDRFLHRFLLSRPLGIVEVTNDRTVLALSMLQSGLATWNLHISSPLGDSLALFKSNQHSFHTLQNLRFCFSASSLFSYQPSLMFAARFVISKNDFGFHQMHKIIVVIIVRAPKSLFYCH